MKVVKLIDLPFATNSSQNLLRSCFIIFDQRKITAKLVNYCEGCQNARIMAALPQAAFAVHKVRLNMKAAAEWQKHLHPEQDYMEDEFQPFQQLPSVPKVIDTTMEQPMKYSSKLMNSIWGLYNRYSVHNFKKNTDGKVILDGEHQLQAAVSHPTLKSFIMSCQGNGMA